MRTQRNNTKRKLPRKRQNIGYLLGFLASLTILVVLFWPGQEHLHSYGPPNTGHEALGCAACHEPANGTAFQQINANIRYYLKLRQTAVDFGHKDVTNAVCQDCHEKPNDRHPVFRFEEPRFAQVRAEIAPHQCVSCHQEHTGVRVNIEPTFCANCHEDLVLKEEPLDVSHQALVAVGNWESCLGCHDFHGNHDYEAPIAVEEATDFSIIQNYFAGGPSPYPGDIIYPAEKERSLPE